MDKFDPSAGELLVRDARPRMDDFYSIYSHGFLRASASPIRIRLADPAANADSVCLALAEAAEAGAGLVAFPELCLSGYAIDDLLQQGVVLDGGSGVHRSSQISTPSTKAR